MVRCGFRQSFDSAALMQTQDVSPRRRIFLMPCGVRMASDLVRMPRILWKNGPNVSVF